MATKVSFSTSVKKSLVKGLRATLTLVATSILTAAGTTLMNPELMTQIWSETPFGLTVIVPLLVFVGQAIVDFARHANNRI